MKLLEIVNLAKISSLSAYGQVYDDRNIIMLLNFAVKYTYSKVPVLTQVHNIRLSSGRYLYNIPKCVGIVNCTVDAITVSSNNKDSGVKRLSPTEIVVSSNIANSEYRSIELELHTEPDQITENTIELLDLEPDVILVTPILSYMAYLASKAISEMDGQVHLNEFNTAISDILASGSYTRTAISQSTDGGFNV